MDKPNTGREIDSLKKKIGRIKTYKGKIQYLKKQMSSLKTRMKNQNILFTNRLRKKLNIYQMVLDELKKSGKKNARGNESNLIHWTGSERELIALALLLEENGLINGFTTPNGTKRWHLIEAHFENKKHKPFNARQLAVTFQKIDLEESKNMLKKNL